MFCPTCNSNNLASKEEDLGGGALATRWECNNCGAMWLSGDFKDCILEFGMHNDHDRCEEMLRNMNPAPYDEAVYNWEDRKSHWKGE